MRLKQLTVATITVVDTYSLSKRVTQDTFIVNEPLLLLAVVYMIMAGMIVLLFKWLESRVPSRTAWGCAFIAHRSVGEWCAMNAHTTDRLFW